MKPTREKVIERAIYWLGYKEKETEKYSHYAAKEYFSVDAGDDNYTYFGYLFGMNPAQWCALFVTTLFYEAAQNAADAKKALYGVWPYANCAQVWEAAPDTAKCKAGCADPQRGDIVLFSKDGICREHTGIVEDVDANYVYTIEGNSSNMVKRRQYALNSSYLYGFIHPDYDRSEETEETKAPRYGKYCYPTVPELSKGNAGFAVTILQTVLASWYNIEIDGEYGPKTKNVVMQFQSDHELFVDGVCGIRTWSKLFNL